MALRKELWRRLTYLTRRSRFQSELSDEMSFHIECRAGELEQGGMPRADALAKARREFGSPIRAVENVHAAWQMRWLEDLLADLRYAARAFRRNPGFAFTAIFCLTLGIGANTTIFSLTTSFLFSVPSGRDAASLISIWEGGNSGSSMEDYKFIRDAQIFDGMGGINPEREVNWRDGDRTSRLYTGLVTSDYFGTLGVPFSLGRGIAPGETTTTVLSHRLWRARFSRDPDILGRKMVLDGRPFTIVGVLPADHRTVVGFGFSPDIYVPVVREDEFVQFYARMPRGMTRQEARTRLRAAFQELDRIHPKEGWKRAGQVTVTGVVGMDVLGQQMMGPVLAFFGMLFIVVSLVLLIACTNVASLLLARASSRSRELAVRLSLGASRMRIVRHLLAESLLLAILGAAAGLLIDVVCARWISSIVLPLPVPIQIVVRPDWRLLLYAIAIAIGSALLAGVMPALKAVRRDVNVALKREERQAASVWSPRGLLVAGQLAVSIVLLATGFLFVHNLLEAASMNPGFEIHSTVWAYMRLVPERYPDQTRQMALVHQALEQLRNLPGVRAAAITRRVPLNDNCTIGTSLKTDLSPIAAHVMYGCNDVGPGYFQAIGIPLLRGREFNAQDRQGSPAVAIVNETFAHTLIGNRDPVGHTFTSELTGSPRLIVGVVKDSKYFTLGETPRLAVYEPYFANEQPVNLHFIVRTASSPAGSVKAITDVLARLDSSAAIETKPLIQSLGLALLPSQAGAVMLGAMGVLGLALASIGLYGVLLYSVARRTREIGVRMALGATPAGVLRIVFEHSLAMLGGGITVGLAIALVATRPLAMFLVPGISPADPASFLSVIAVLGIVGLGATLVPALRALRVDPMTALRYE